MNARIELLDEPRDALEVQEPRAIATQPGQHTPATIMALAIQQGAPVETIERMWALQVAWEEREAKKAYAAAMAQFKRNAPVITKDKHVKFSTQKGVTEYDHATLGNVTKTIAKGLADYGLTASWNPKKIEGGRVQVTCTLTHDQCHSESVTLDAALDDSGGKNNIQALGSAISYLERYTLLAITGLATEDDDDDGRSAGKGETDAHAFQLRDDWIGRANSAINDAVLKRTWQMGLEEIKPLNRMDVYTAFKDAVAAKGAQLTGGAK